MNRDPGGSTLVLCLCHTEVLMNRHWILFLAGAVSGLVIASITFVFDAWLGVLPPPFTQSEQYNICAAIQDTDAEPFVGTSTEPSYTIHTHWSSTYHRCIIDTTAPGSDSTIERASALDPTTLLAYIAIDNRTRKVKQCDIWLDWNAAGKLIAAHAPVSCSSQKEFDTYVIPLMSN
jgi:hypothetical protein